jgi:hypothetical protein
MKFTPQEVDLLKEVYQKLQRGELSPSTPFELKNL